LLVASPYDAFILEADGQLSELVLSETLDATPAITSVASGREALRLLAGGRRFDLVVATLHVGDVNAVEIGRTLLEKDPHAPLVILASDARELAEFLARHGAAGFEEAWDDFLAYEAEILGVISDVEFPRARAWSATAGIELARDVRTAAPDVPIVLQSSRPENDALARAAGAAFLLKGSPTLLHEL